MCIFFNVYDTLGEILYHTIVQKIGQKPNIQKCQQTFRDATWKKFEKKIYTFLLQSYFFLYIQMVIFYRTKVVYIYRKMPDPDPQRICK